MTKEGAQSASELEDLLRRLEEAWQAFMDVLEGPDPERFAVEDAAGQSIRQVLERTADDPNFCYERLVARALSLPRPPCLQKAEFGSLREAVVSLQRAHRRFCNLLHDLIPADLARTATDEKLGTYTLRQLLEMTTAQYAMRAQQTQHILAQTFEGNQR